MWMLRKKVGDRVIFECEGNESIFSLLFNTRYAAQEYIRNHNKDNDELLEAAVELCLWFAPTWGGFNRYELIEWIEFIKEFHYLFESEIDTVNEWADELRWQAMKTWITN